LLGEQAVAAAHANHAILRTSWIYSPFGKNFVKTMLRLARDRDEISVVADQFGGPTSAHDIADGIIGVCRNLVAQPANLSLRGVFHMSATGTGTWAEFATAIFAESAKLGGPSARVRPLSTADYPTPARRPANSRLNSEKIASIHGIALPEWRISLQPCIRRLLEEGSF
jgi:dTDP-4-dehydrorhamnose reductase